MGLHSRVPTLRAIWVQSSTCPGDGTYGSWSEDSGTPRVKQRGFFPFNFRQGTKEPRNSSAIFANFIYQVSVRVDSNDIKDDYSWIMGGDAADDPTSDELRPAKQGTAHLAPVKLITTRHSECPGSTALTNCQVILQRAIEGRIILTAQERTGEWSELY